MGFNPVHYRKTWQSIGMPFDPPAVSDLNAPWSAISLLKSVLGATMGIIPPGAVGTEQLAEHAVTFPKIRLVAGFSLIGRALPFSGEVHEVFLDQNGLVFDGVNKLQLAPAVGDVTAPIGTRTFTLANSVVGDNNIKPFSIDLTTKAAIATPNKLWGTTGSGVTVQWSNGSGVLFQNNTISVISGPGGLQPWDQGLQQLANLTTPAIYWLAGPDNWAPVTMGVGMTFSGGVLSSTGSGGGGGISTSGQVVANQIPAYTSSTGTLVRGTNLPPEIILSGDNMTFTGNLAALSAVSGTNTIYYRISNLGWGPVTFSTAFTFNGNLDLAPGLLHNLHTLNPTADTYTLFHGNAVVTAEPISPFSQVVITSPDAAAWRTAIGAGTPYQLDPDLASIAAITATNALVYRISANTWGPVTIGANLSFAGGILSATSTAGGNVVADGVPAAQTLAYWTSATTIAAALLGSGLTFASNTLTLDADLVALAAFTGGGIPNRIALNNTWQMTNVTGGLNLSASGVLAITDPNLVALIGAGIGTADKVPYFTGPVSMTQTTLTSFGRQLIATVDAAAARALLGVPSAATVQPLDADLTSLAAASATNSIYFRSAADLWAPVTIGANLTFTGGVLAAVGGGAGSGDVTSTGTGFATTTLAGYADTTGDVIRSVTFPAEGFSLVGSQITLNGDLGALEGLTGTGIYFRSAASTWSLATFSSGISFPGGQFTLAPNLVAFAGLSITTQQLPYFTGPAAMSTTGISNYTLTLFSKQSGQQWMNALGAQPQHFNLDQFTALVAAPDLVPFWATVGSLQGFTMTAAMRTLMASSSASALLTAIGGQPLDADLSAIAALTGTNVIYYRSAANVWSAVAIGAGLTFTGGSLAATANTTGLAPLDSPAFIGIPTAPTAATATNTTQLATCAYVQSNIVNLQPLDGDLTSLAAASSVAIYYRQGTNSWAPVTVGAGLSFTGGTLTATATGGGNVSSSGTGFAATTLAGWTDATGTLIRALTMPAAGLTISGSALALADDLASLEALTGTNSIYRRSGTNTWAAVTYGTGILLDASGQLTLQANLVGLASVGAGADAVPYFTSGGGAMAVFTSNTFTRGLMGSADAAAYRTAIGAGNAGLSTPSAQFFSNTNWFYQPIISTASPATYNSGAPMQAHRGAVGHADIEATSWSANVGYQPRMVMRKSNSDVIGTFTSNGAGLVGSQFGQIVFMIDNGVGGWVTGGMMTCTNAQPIDASFNPTRFGFYTCSAIGGDGLQERFFVDAYGRFCIGKGSAASPWLEKLQVHGLDGYAAQIIARWSADTGYPNIYLDKSRGASIGSMVPVVTNDILGMLQFRGVDSSNAMTSAVQIYATVSGAPSAGLVPATLNFGIGGNASGKLGLQSGWQAKGAVDGSDVPAAGWIGEHVAGSPFGGAIAAQLVVAQGAINLSPGDWDVWVQGNITTGASPTTTTIGLNTSANLPGASMGLTQIHVLAASVTVGFSHQARFNLASTTTVSFVVNSGLNGVQNVSGGMFARRRR
jgi:hypothetical protein